MNTARIDSARPETVAHVLAGILARSERSAGKLKRALADEREALAGRDADRLDEAVAAKQEQVQTLDRLETRRANACKAAGISADAADMNEVLAWCDTDSTLSASWSRLLALGSECEGLNLGNGAIIRLRQQQIAAGLLVLRGAANEMNTYGPTGAAATLPGGRTLTEA